MLGLLFIYFLGNMNFKLAIRYDKNKWLYAFIGIVAYYGGMFSFAMAYGVFMAVIGQDLPDDWEPSIFENIIFIILGGGVFYGVHKLLERKWERERLQSPVLEIDSIGESLEV